MGVDFHPAKGRGKARWLGSSKAGSKANATTALAIVFGWLVGFRCAVAPSVLLRWSQFFIHPVLWPFDSETPLEAFHILGDPEKQVAGISRARKHLLAIAYPPIIPNFDQRLDKSQAVWKTWCTAGNVTSSRYLPQMTGGCLQ